MRKKIILHSLCSVKVEILVILCFNRSKKHIFAFIEIIYYHTLLRPWFINQTEINIPEYCFIWATLPIRFPRFFVFPFSHSHRILDPWHVHTHTHTQRHCIGKTKAQGLSSLHLSSSRQKDFTLFPAFFLTFTLKVSHQTEVVRVLWGVLHLMELLLTEGALIFTDEKTAEMTHHKLCLQLRRRAVIYWAISCVFTQMHYCRGCFSVSVSFVLLFHCTSAISSH